MGIWSGIKHALNSTLGTDEFKPLDKLLSDLIAEERDLVASDNLYRYIFAGEKYFDTRGEKIFSFRTNRNGSFRLKYNIKASQTNYSRRLIIYCDGVKVYEYYIGQLYEDEEIIADFQCVKGNKFEIELMTNIPSTSSSSIYIKDMRICANEMDISGITIL